MRGRGGVFGALRRSWIAVHEIVGEDETDAVRGDSTPGDQRLRSSGLTLTGASFEHDARELIALGATMPLEGRDRFADRVFEVRGDREVRRDELIAANSHALRRRWSEPGGARTFPGGSRSGGARS